jgi:uncharacterized small protein (DUF1192 family)
MIESDENEPRSKPAKQRDLVPLSIAELELYIAEMEAEILRVREAIAAKQQQRRGAQGLFKI